MPRRGPASENAPPQVPVQNGVTKEPAGAAEAPPPVAPPVPSALLATHGLSRTVDGAYELADAFLFRQRVDHACQGSSDVAEKLVADLADAWSDPESLRAALQPTRAPQASRSGGGASSSFYGDSGIKDSVVRLLLQCAYVQTPLARHLLQVLPEYQEELEGAASHAGMPIAKLVLSQFRWLEHVADGSGERSRTRKPGMRARAHGGRGVACAPSLIRVPYAAHPTPPSPVVAWPPAYAKSAPRNLATPSLSVPPSALPSSPGLLLRAWCPQRCSRPSARCFRSLRRPSSASTCW